MQTAIRRAATAVVLCFGCAHGALAQAAKDGGPAFFFLGSAQLPVTDNALSSPTDRRWDAYLNVDVKTGLSGTLPGDKSISYQVYVRALVDAFRKESEGNDSISLVGGTISKDIWNWTFTAGYENRQYYNLAFDFISFIANDFKIG